jgi:hypothetical protein
MAPPCGDRGVGEAELRHRLRAEAARLLADLAQRSISLGDSEATPSLPSLAM